MRQRLVLAVLSLLVPSTGFAQTVPERLLPRGSQIYLRWDGLDAHRDAFDKSAVGKMLKGDTGTFLAGFVSFLEKQVDALAGQEMGLAEILRDVPKAIRSLGKHGFRLGVEARSFNPVEIEGMLVFPKAGKADEVLLPLIRKIGVLAGAEIKEIKVGKRTVFHIPLEPVHLGWWQDGDDAVVVLGTDEPEKVAKAAHAKGPHFTAHPLYKELKSFKEFTTWADGFLDLTSLAKIGGAVSPDLAKLIDQLGLKGLKSVTFHSGFEGTAEHSVILVDMPGPRKGLLSIANRRNIKLADLPPLPPDVTSFSASNLDLARVYDAVVAGIEAGVQIFAPNQADAVKQGIKFVEGLIGVKLREELFGSLGDMFVHYNSPAEGVLGLGGVYLVKVKDADKLQKAMDKLVNGLGGLPIGVTTNRREYHKAEITEIQLGGEGTFQLPAYTIHKGWLAFSLYPQPIKGFVLRANGDLATWKPGANLSKRLAKFPDEFVSISVSDPRPTIKFIFSIAPPLVALINSFTARFAPGAQFDINLIPNAHEATRHLFPNITVITDDGKKLRIETRASLALPF
jgi:hypothetical protein